MQRYIVTYYWLYMYTESCIQSIQNSECIQVFDGMECKPYLNLSLIESFLTVYFMLGSASC